MASSHQAVTDEVSRQEAKIKDLTVQLEHRSAFEHQIIKKLEELSEKYRVQNKVLKEFDSANKDLRKEN